MTKVTYEAVTPDGHHIVVTTGRSAARVFYGTVEHMEEGHITGTALSCADELDFNIESTPYSAVFAPPTCNNAMASRLLIGVATTGQAPVPIPLTILVGFGQQADAGSAMAPADLNYFCL